MKNDKGFTLIEMMIVLVVISILLIVTIPNITKHNSKINDTGCEALTKMVQAEVQSYYMEHKAYPESMAILKEENYITEEQQKCTNGKELIITNGVVSTSGTENP
ncbi:ComG operon protein 3 precursor [Mycobacteroides abscessus subsp. abscessus]|nr:ComG operon protein 3 precursor [Mycobacteroides abscessus subsp. abscessus]HEO8418664.1 prepilin-type N-terminal cleavage/methylation domain-containing protein [Yersinia enterocolitica]